MIDWSTTEEKLGKVDLLSFRPKVIVKCDKCSKQATFTIRVKSRLINNQLNWLCYKCACNQKEVKDVHSQQMIKQWKKEEYKKEREEGSTELWQNKEYRKKISDADTAFWQQNPNIKEELRQYYTKKYADEEYRRKRREESIELWKDPTFREKVTKGTQQSAVLNGEPSSLHIIIKNMLNTWNIPWEPEFAVGPYNFDFLIKPPGNKPILLEINGDYWHHLAGAVARDKRKATYAENLSQTYNFMVIWEYEFYTKGRVESRLKRIMGLEQAPILVDFDFKDVQIKEVLAKQARVFFTQYHYSGSLGRGGIIYGAFLGEELIAAISFSPIIRKEVAIKQQVKCKEILELSRFAIADNRHKKNLASWLITKTIALLPPIKKIISYADVTFGHNGIIYKAAGFRLDGIVQPSYWYIDPAGWVMHKKTLYEHAHSLRMTEQEFATKYNYRRTYGAEKYRYVLDLR